MSPQILFFDFLDKSSFKNGITMHRALKITPGLIVQKYVLFNYFLQNFWTIYKPNALNTSQRSALAFITDVTRSLSTFVY